MANPRYMAQILDDVKAFVRRYCILPDEDCATVFALWILHTWTFDPITTYATPYLYVSSPEPGSGKTRVLEIAQLIARNPVDASNLTASSLFRRMETQPTVLIDEVDGIFNGAKNEDMRVVLNSGYKRGGNVWRVVMGESTEFPTFGPKLMVGLDNSCLPGTLIDRCIEFRMKRKKDTQVIERFIPRKVEPEAEELAKRIEQWAVENTDALLDIDPDSIEIIEEISDRKFEIAEPLLILARLCGIEDEARKALTNLLRGKAAPPSLGVQILTQAREMFDSAGVDRIMSSALAAHFGINTKKLGVELAKYDIQSSTLQFGSGDTRDVKKGYERVSFTDAWERYL